MRPASARSRIALLCGVLVAGAMAVGQGQSIKRGCHGDNLSACHFLVLIPAFDWHDPAQGPALATNVALALTNQVFRNFRVNLTDTEGPGSCCLVSDAVAYQAERLQVQSHAEALRRGREVSALTVLWGQSWPWRGRIVVQPYLSMVGPPNLNPEIAIGNERRRRPFVRGDVGERWRIWDMTATGADGRSHSLSIDRFPRDTYDLPQISLDANAIKDLSSLANQPVFEDDAKGLPSSNVLPRRSGSSIKALQHYNDFVKIEDPRGWIKLPRVNAGATVDFIGAIVHFSRGNWERALTGFDAILKNPSAPSNLRLDSALLLAATSFRKASCAMCADALARAKAINPYSTVVAQYDLMVGLAADSSAANRRSLRDWVATRPSLFPPEDDFTKRALKFLDGLIGGEAR